MPRRRYSIAEARNGLAKLVREAEAGQEIALTRRGKPVAVLIGRGDYERLTSGARSFWDAYRAFREEAELVDLDIDPDIIFRSVRERSPGRDVIL